MKNRFKDKYSFFIEIILILLVFVFVSLLVNKIIKQDELIVDVAVSEQSKLILEGARKEVANKTRYKSQYYQGGYPPDNEGVCTDLVWRALMNAGYDLKFKMDQDIKNNFAEYSRIDKPDPNIDFRRVPNQQIYLTRNEKSLTKEIIPRDLDSVKEWQAGDIVIISNPQHVGIISDKRNKDGIPYVIHNIGPYPKEEDVLGKWSNKIEGHFRLYD